MNDPATMIISARVALDKLKSELGSGSSDVRCRTAANIVSFVLQSLPPPEAAVVADHLSSIFQEAKRRAARGIPQS